MRRARTVAMAFSERRYRVQGRRPQAWLGVVAIAVAQALVVLSGCTPPPPPERPLADLHLAHVVKIPGIEELERRVGIHDLLEMTTYHAATTPHADHVLFHLLGGATYDVLLDGSGLRQIATSCGPIIGVTSDGRWLLCDYGNGTPTLHDLTSQDQHDDKQVMTNADDLRLGLATLTPDGHHLATVNDLAGGCAIAVYTMDATYSAFSLSALLALPEYLGPGVGGSVCNVSTLAWSPDGRWLAFMGGPGYSMNVIAVPPALQDILRSPTAPTTQPMIPIAPESIHSIGTTNPSSEPVWSPTADTMTQTSGQGWDILDVNVQTHQQRVLVTQRTAGIFSVSWTPDGRHLVFVLGLPHDEYQPPPAQIYVYTPGS